MGDTRYKVTIITPTHNPYEHNLNRIRKDFLEGSFSYWLNIDADNPPINNPLDLIAYEKDVIALPTPQWHLTVEEARKNSYPVFLNCMDVHGEGWKEHADKQGLQEIGACGSGCMLIARHVVEHTPPFSRVYDSDGIVTVGADFNWCRDVKTAGYKIWAHYEYFCRHFKEVDMLETSEGFYHYFTSQH
jgi:hypothetical protein